MEGTLSSTKIDLHYCNCDAGVSWCKGDVDGDLSKVYQYILVLATCQLCVAATLHSDLICKHELSVHSPVHAQLDRMAGWLDGWMDGL